jgi:hypothetical protein
LRLSEKSTEDRHSLREVNKDPRPHRTGAFGCRFADAGR